jgi:uncharacterized protein (TIGR03437 family)
MAAAALCLAGDTVVCKPDAPYPPYQPCYSGDGIVNIASGIPGAIAPNTLASIHGTLLSYSEKGLVPSDVSAGGVLPIVLPGTGVRVFVGGYPAHIFYASEDRVNFLVPSNLRPTTVDVQLVRDGVAGPAVSMKLRDAAPALFMLDPLFVIASHLDFSLVTADAPARPGDWVILWATGLGESNPPADYGVIPTKAAWIVRQSEFRVLLNGAAVPPERITYVGLAPLCAGLYQINVLLPSDADPDPEVKIEVKIAVGTEISPAGTRLHLRAPAN